MICIQKVLKPQSSLMNMKWYITLSFDLTLDDSHPYSYKLIEAKKRHITVNDTIECKFQLRKYGDQEKAANFFL